jgi:hypothetical protein
VSARKLLFFEKSDLFFGKNALQIEISKFFLGFIRSIKKFRAQQLDILISVRTVTLRHQQNQHF